MLDKIPTTTKIHCVANQYDVVLKKEDNNLPQDRGLAEASLAVVGGGKIGFPVVQDPLGQTGKKGP